MHNLAVALQAIALVIALIVFDAFMLFLFPPVIALLFAAAGNSLVMAFYLKRI